jgi:hypothetical protein
VFVCILLLKKLEKQQNLSLVRSLKHLCIKSQLLDVKVLEDALPDVLLIALLAVLTVALLVALLAVLTVVLLIALLAVLTVVLLIALLAVLTVVLLIALLVALLVALLAVLTVVLLVALAVITTVNAVRLAAHIHGLINHWAAALKDMVAAAK